MQSGVESSWLLQGPFDDYDCEAPTCLPSVTTSWECTLPHPDPQGRGVLVIP